MVPLIWFLGSIFTSAAVQERGRSGRPGGSPAGLGGGPTGATADAKISVQERGRSGRPGGSPAGLGGGPTGATADAKILQAQDEFLPYAASQIDIVRDDAPIDLTDWRSLARRLPYLTEAVAMYFTMEDPQTPNTVKLSIASALVYTVSSLDIVPDWIPFLGQADDAAVLVSAMYYVYGYVTQEHIERAKEWLRSHGVQPKPLFALGKQFDRVLPDGSIGVETPSAQ